MKKIIKKEVFENELKICRQVSKEKGGRCAWGKCNDCGVIPLLYKLHKGKFLENPKEIKTAKDKVLR